MRVLIIEDEPMLRTTYVRGLARLDGAEVRAAGDLEEGLSQIDHGFVPTVVISDIDLPRRSGLELIGELGRRGLHPPVVFVSGYLQAYRSQVPPHANVEVLEKPVSIEVLRELVVRHSTERRRSSADLAPFSAADYLTLAGMGRHSVVVEIERGGRWIGEVVIWNGDPWSAKDHDGAGLDALRRLAFAAGTQVHCRTLVTEPTWPRDLRGSWEGLLLDAARARDEEQRHALGQPEPPAAGGESLFPLAPPPEPAVDPFDEAWERGVEALLGRRYTEAAAAFLEADRLRPGQPKVAVNLKRLAELGALPEKG